VALVAASTPDFAGSPTGPKGAALIAAGRHWAAWHHVPTDDADVLLRVGYFLQVLGDSPDLLADVLTQLAIPYTWQERKGRLTVVRIEPEAESSTPNTKVEVEPPVKKRRRNRGERLDSKLDLRLPSEERQELAAWAERKGLTLGEYVRQLLAQGVWYAKGEQLEKQERDHREELVSSKRTDDVLTRFKRALNG
jgi:hypothetical protein